MTRARLHGSHLGLVAIGAAVGATVRWTLDTSLTAGDGYPWVTLLINVTGAFALGVLPVLAAVRDSHALALVLGPGLLGGFTTVSTWALEVRDLAATGHPALAGLHLGGTLAAAIVAAQLGRRMARQPEPEDALT